MAAGNEYDHRNNYINGNAAPQWETVPERAPKPQKDREQIERERQRKLAARRNQKNAMVMNRGYVAFLTMASIICFGVCGLFVHIQADITTRISSISSLEIEVEDMKAANAASERRIETTMSLEEVKNAASSMGMSYPDQGQIRYYAVESSDYMNQYENIPSD